MCRNDKGNGDMPFGIANEDVCYAKRHTFWNNNKLRNLDKRKIEKTRGEKKCFANTVDKRLWKGKYMSVKKSLT